jgi:hypothetical protein
MQVGRPGRFGTMALANLLRAFLQPSKESLTNNPFSRFLTAAEIENLYTQSPDFDVYTYHCELEQQKRIATYYKKTAPVGRGVKVDTGKGMGMRIKDCARGGYIKKVNKRGSIKKERKVRKGGKGGKGALFGNVWIPRR